MQLSERAAIVSAIVDGKFHIYPAGKLMELIKKTCSGDRLDADFDRVRTVEKIKKISLSQFDADTKAILEDDLTALCKILAEMDNKYDFEGEIAAITSKLPPLADLYFGIKNFKSEPVVMVEYYFEGYNDLYKNSDWYAFNVDPVESAQMKVPVAAYYKRSWIMPFSTPHSIIHENIHQMQALSIIPKGEHRYVPWFDEGMADVVSLMMFYKITNDRKRFFKIKKFMSEVEVLATRKATYAYAFRLFGRLIGMAGWPFFRALAEIYGKYYFDIDLNVLADGIIQGVEPRDLIGRTYKGAEKNAFEREFGEIEKKHLKSGGIEEKDLEVLNIFAVMQPPAALSAAEYRAALWFNEQVTKFAEKHLAKVELDKLQPVKDFSSEARNKIAGFNEKVVVLEKDIPAELKAGAEELGNKYFAVKSEIGGKVIFDAWFGGLPFRLGCGEIRCELNL